MNNVRRFRDAILSVALLILPFFFLSANLKDPSRVGTFDEGLLKISEPLQYVGAQTAAAVSSVVEDYVYLWEVRAENDRLSLENAVLEEEARELRIQAEENNRLRRLLELRDRLGGETVNAEVVARDTTPFFRVLRVRLDRGQRDRVDVGMPVVSTRGLVGQIRRVTGHTADVLLTVDQESAIDVIVQPAGARGMLQGTGESNQYLARVQYLERDEEIAVGDEVYTSGLGRRFPASILVGRVTRVTRAEFGLYQEVEVTPSVNFSQLSEVLIIMEGSREQSVRPRRSSGTEE